MIILTAANWRYKEEVAFLSNCATKFGYKFVTYDLGGLGFGIDYKIHDKNFVDHGYYCRMVGDWYSKSLHKPDVVYDCLKEFNEFTVYLDADTCLLNSIDEVVGDYDIGVTTRKEGENCQVIGKINAGVIFFNPSSIDLVAQWKKLTVEHKNDQRALNVLFDSNFNRFAKFPGEVYNNYYTSNPDFNVKILHFKDNKSDIKEFINRYKKRVFL